MPPPQPPLSASVNQLVLVRPEPSGQYTAQLVGLAEVRATAGTREEAIEQMRTQLRQALASGQLVTIEVPRDDLVQQWEQWAQSDLEYNLYRQEIQRFRQEEEERFRKEEADRPCSHTSSTPTT
jgi:hypothetical protein